GKQVWRRPSSCRPSKGTNHSDGKNHPVSGGSGNYTVAVPERSHTRPCSFRYYGHLFARQRHHQNGQNPQRAVFGKQPQMERGRHGTGSGTRTRSVAYRMGKIVADFNNKSIWKITNRNSRRERPTTAV